jgi:rare lipoprotein A
MLGRYSARLVVALIGLIVFACGERLVSGAVTLPAVATSEWLTTADAATRAGPTEVGKASIYPDRMRGKRMANGEPYRPNSDVAASTTLPIGTVAEVTNLKNGRSTIVRVADRGPFCRGRIVDLAPQAARKLGLMEKQGVAPVVVKPVKAPQFTVAQTELRQPTRRHARC